VKASLDRTAWADDGADGLPTLGVVTVASGPFGAAALQAARPAQQHYAGDPCQVDHVLFR
jgi:hypothetical protein